MAATRIERVLRHDGIVAVLDWYANPPQFQDRMDPQWVGDARWHPIMHEAVKLRQISGEPSVRVLVGDHAVLVSGDDTHVVGIVFIKGHPVVKSVVRMVRQLLKPPGGTGASNKSTGELQEHRSMNHRSVNDPSGNHAAGHESSRNSFAGEQPPTNESLGTAPRPVRAQMPAMHGSLRGVAGGMPLSPGGPGMPRAPHAMPPGPSRMPPGPNTPLRPMGMPRRVGPTGPAGPGVSGVAANQGPSGRGVSGPLGMPASSREDGGSNKN